MSQETLTNEQIIQLVKDKFPYNPNGAYIVVLVSLLPEEEPATPAVALLLAHTQTLHGIGWKQEEKPDSLSKLQEAVSIAYRKASGPTVASIIATILYHQAHPESESVTKSRYDDWHGLATGLDLGIFVVDDDGDTLLLNPQIQRLFFSPDNQ